MREMTIEEKLLYHCDEFENQMFTAGSTQNGKSKAVKAEAAVKITVKKKDSEQLDKTISNGE